ncbi:hypothetical protein B5G34_14975 [Flavonifractor sp. An82]|nr:hypothetical protein B5G34_14975 [Flavonifractor sp. An82]
MSYTLEIYAYEDKLVFTGTLNMYFDKYKGLGPGLYSKPIVCLERTCTSYDIEDAIKKSISVLETNKDTIFQENSVKTITQMENLIFRNFKLFGINAPKSQIIKGSTLIMIRTGSKFFVSRCVPEGKDMIVQDKVPLSPEATIPDIASIVFDFLNI